MEKITENTTQGPYQLERQQIINEIGELEMIRKTLGLSRRKLCKLILVDPSSWTRWTKPGGPNAPAYIYRSLQWCLAIMEKYPESHPLVRSLSYEKENKVDQLHKKIEDRLSFNRSMTFDLKTEMDELKKSNFAIKESNKLLKRALIAYGLLSLLVFCLLIYIQMSRT